MGYYSKNYNVRNYLYETGNVYNLNPIAWELTLDGWIASQPGGNGCLSDNLSRAFDIGGRAMWIDSNWFHNVGSDPGNDGEGILCQLHGGTDIQSWALTRNTKGVGGKSSYIGGWGVMQAGSLIAWNKGTGGYGCFQPAGSTLIDAAFVANDLTGSTCGFASDYTMYM